MSRPLAIAVLSSVMAAMAVNASPHEAPARSPASGPGQALEPSPARGTGKTGETEPASTGSALPQVELVAVYEGDDLVLYVDDYASDAPIEGLQVDLNLGSRSLRAVPMTEGRYRLPADLLDANTAAPSRVTLQGAALALSLPITLPVPTHGHPDSAVANHAAAPSPRAAALTLAAVIASLVVALIRRRRYRARRVLSETEQPA